MSAPNQLVHAIGRVQQVTDGLVRRRLGGGERERDRLRVAMFHVEHSAIDAIFEVDRLPREPRRRSRLQPSPPKTERLDGFGQISRRRLIRTASRPLLAADVNQAIQKRPGRDHERLAAETAPVFELEAANLAAIRAESARRGPESSEYSARASSAARTHAAVSRLVRLGARRPHRRPAAAIEQLELYSRSVDCSAHQSAERIDLSDQMSLSRAADRGIARHVRDGFSSERAQADAASELRRRPRGLDAGVPGADRRLHLIQSLSLIMIRLSIDL